ncbi:sugar O-acyltransferase, sialic acid O-acetyltransferase NeuD family [Paraburkholderia phenazinium]|jgi:sugar O-acyltransferase (sialic acid O-acetyltransferase NeuD family)|uniref:Sugar O-acyltransferase, sialic acid O-acetyltransferase NeuD family n=2 Tax=Paraburkholderia phenazinium TaxID=60549 RepID=A0A1G8HYQ6_9BURK|nr:sugar O-acyltransferase, sialic acid O-acetyltransferase NeuD family [Paraburkholderia phenazinium]
MASRIDGCKMKKLLIVGAGGHGKSVAEAALACGSFELVGFVDDAAPELTSVWDWPVLGTTASLAEYRSRADAAIVAIGNNGLREALFDRLGALGFELPAVVHPTAIVSPRTIIGPGSAIMAGSIIGTEAKLGAGSIVNSGAVVDHHCTVEDFGHLGVNTSMAGGSILGRAAWMQAGSALGYGVRVQDGVVLAPGTALQVSREH